MVFSKDDLAVIVACFTEKGWTGTRIAKARPRPNVPTNSSATTMFPLQLCGGKPSVAVTRERRYGPSRLRVNDDDDETCGDAVGFR